MSGRRAGAWRRRMILPLIAVAAAAPPLGPERAWSVQEGLAAPQGAPGDRFQNGNRLYQAGDYSAALAAYLELYDDGLESGNLHYNIGNAYFKVGDLGRAILHYERAQLELPRDETVRANLELARSLTADQITPLPGFWVPRVVSWWVDLLPRTWLIVVVAAGYLALSTALLFRMLSPRSSTWASRLAIGAALFTLVFGVNLTVRELGIGRAERGVILEAQATVQSAPSDDPSLQLFTIHEGTVVRIDRRSEEWLEVVLEDGKVGWVRAWTVEVI